MCVLCRLKTFVYFVGLHTHMRKVKKNKNKVGQVRGFGTHIWHHQRAPSACFTHFALRPGGGGGERGRGGGFFGLTEEAVLLTSDPHKRAVLCFGTLPGAQCVPRQRLPVRYRNEKHQPANQREEGSSWVWLPRQQGCLWTLCGGKGLKTKCDGIYVLLHFSTFLTSCN